MSFRKSSPYLYGADIDGDRGETRQDWEIYSDLSGEELDYEDVYKNENDEICSYQELRDSIEKSVLVSDKKDKNLSFMDFKFNDPKHKDRPIPTNRTLSAYEWFWKYQKKCDDGSVPSLDEPVYYSEDLDKFYSSEDDMSDAIEDYIADHRYEPSEDDFEDDCQVDDDYDCYRENLYDSSDK